MKRTFPKDVNVNDNTYSLALLVYTCIECWNTKSALIDIISKVFTMFQGSFQYLDKIVCKYYNIDKISIHSLSFIVHTSSTVLHCMTRNMY